ncbi:MAG: hypothetical protein ACXWUP_08475 [Allosphingosinicella sp.]
MSSTTIVIIVAVLAVLILAFLLIRGRPQRIEKAPREGGERYVASTERPYMKDDWVTDELAAATANVAGEVLGVNAHRELSGSAGPADNLEQLKGVGPKFAVRLIELGITRFEQLASFSEAELVHLDERLGPFRGRLVRDRVAEQADYLARGDIDGFEERFGKLGA